MSREELKQYVPDTPEEWRLIGKYINHLGTSMSAVLLFSADKWWVIASLGLTWFGASATDYFGHKSQKNSDEKPA
jgi:hypothetical protein